MEFEGPDEEERPAEGAVAKSRSRPRGPDLAIAVCVFALAATTVYGGVFLAGAASFTPMSPDHGPRAVAIENTRRADVTFEAWLVARHARTLLTRPQRLFDTEHCAPAEQTLTLGIPAITMGILAIPASLFTSEPILIYNVTLVMVSLLAALAMYALVTSWTGVAAAGIAAGLMFGFQATRLSDIAHPTVWDASWTVLAMYFAERLFSRGRWRDAIGLAAAIALQIGASFYQLLAATFTTPPFLAWLLYRHRLRHVRVTQLAFVAASSAIAAVVVLGPYLGATLVEGKLHRESFFFASLQSYLPSEILFFHWSVLALATVALVLPHRLATPGMPASPRWALLIGAISVVWIASGNTNQEWVARLFSAEAASWFPNLYGGLASVLPGLDAVRGVYRLSQGAYLACVVLAGLGAAALIRRSGRHAGRVAVALVLMVALDVLRAPSLGWERRYRWELQDIAPSAASVEFFDELERRGNRGPIFELPVSAYSTLDPRRILLSAYHGRRTSACFGSYMPGERSRLAALAAQLPKRKAVDALIRLGFTTLVVHRQEPSHRQGVDVELDRARGGSRRIERIHRTPQLVAYALLPRSVAP